MNVNIVEGTGDWIKFNFKSPEMTVKTKKLKKLPNGEHVDDLEATADTAEQQLADNMTKYYDEIGKKKSKKKKLLLYGSSLYFRTKIPTSSSIEGTYQDIGNVRYTQK